MPKPIELKVDGMTCANCAAGINRYLHRKGLEDVYVNFSTKEVRFTPIPGTLSLEEAKAGIQKLGYTIIELDQPKAFWTLERKLGISALFTAPLLLDHLLMMFGGPRLPFLHLYWVQFAFCLPVFLIGLLHFGKSAWGSLKGGVPNMDVLIFIGSTAAFIYSIVGTIQQHHDYIFYETAAMIITLVLLGNLMEKRAVEQTTSSIDELAKLKVEKAQKVMPSGAIVSLPVQDIQIGDHLRVNQGDSIPLDGKIIEGTAHIDESMLSGESIPVDKTLGDAVIGASILSSGNIVMEVTATGYDTVLSRMIELVKNAQQEKPDIQRLADKISAIFVPVVLVIATLTFVIAVFGFGLAPEKAMMNAIAVLVISCPCAMGLATPTAVMVGVGRVARNGILIRGGQTLETFARIKHIVFDKTGTLTTGDFKIKAIHYLEEEPALIHALLFELEQHSSHPIAQSLRSELAPLERTKDLPVFTKIEEQKGYGLLAEDETGRKYRLGSWKVAKEQTNDDTHQVYLLRDEQVLATVDLSDAIKPDAQATLDYLRKQGIDPILLSGDREEKVKETAQQLGISRYFGSKLPEEKLAMIADLSAQEATAMVGDGINDAPALAKATIGVSLSDASQVAIQSAQIVLLQGKLEALTKALAISKHTLLTIKQNLFWAFAYNVIAIPIAAFGFLNPMWGALFMAMSDVVVIGNSIRLKYKKVN